MIKTGFVNFLSELSELSTLLKIDKWMYKW